MTKLFAVPGASVHIDGYGVAQDHVGVDVPDTIAAELLQNPALTSKRPDPPPAPAKAEESTTKPETAPAAAAPKKKE